jgi:serine/threonine protein kinase
VADTLDGRLADLTRTYVIGGLKFEVDARYSIKSVVGKGAYGLVCAAEDLQPRLDRRETGGDGGGGSGNSSSSSSSPAPSESGAPPPPAAAPPPLPHATRARVAVKKVIDPFHDHTDCKRLLREIRFLRCLYHPNLLHLTDIMPPSGKPGKSPSPEGWKDVYLVTRLFDTNLHRVIYSGHALTDAHIQYILWQVFRALRYLHRAGVVHRDMKPTNLLLNRDCELALADFGLARYMGPALAAGAHTSEVPGEPSLSPRRSPPTVGGMASLDGGAAAATADGTQAGQAGGRKKKGQLTKYVVTRWYRAPELLVQNRKYDAKVDLWSTGCMIAELLGCKALFPGKDSLHQLRVIVELLGVPSEEELSFIHNPQAVTYIRNLRPKGATAGSTAVGSAAVGSAAVGSAAVGSAAVGHGTPGIHGAPRQSPSERFAQMYPAANPLLLDLMSRLLHFDPRMRPSAAEALRHPYLAAYAEAPEEDLPVPEVEMEFEHEEPGTEELRQLIWQEVLHYHPNGSPHGLPHGRGPARGGAAAM